MIIMACIRLSRTAFPNLGEDLVRYEPKHVETAGMERILVMSRLNCAEIPGLHANGHNTEYLTRENSSVLHSKIQFTTQAAFMCLKPTTCPAFKTNSILRPRPTVFFVLIYIVAKTEKGIYIFIPIIYLPMLYFFFFLDMLQVRNILRIVTEVLHILLFRNVFTKMKD